MQTWAKRGIQTALVTGGLLMLGTGIASADENVSPDSPAGPVDVNASVPIDISKNAVGTLGKQVTIPGVRQEVSTAPVTDTVNKALAPLVRSGVLNALSPVTGVVNGVAAKAAGAAGQAGQQIGQATNKDAAHPADPARQAVQAESDGDPALGNKATANLVVPIQITGNAVGALGNASAHSNSNQTYAHSTDINTSGAGGGLAGNAVSLDWALPVQISGNALALGGRGKTSGSATQSAATTGDIATSGTNGALAGNVVSPQGATPVQVSGNALGAPFGHAETDFDADSSATSGGWTKTNGALGAISGNVANTPLALPLKVSNNAIAGGGDADVPTGSSIADATAGDQAPGMNGTPTYIETNGDHAFLGGTVAQPQVATPGTVAGNAAGVIGNAVVGSGPLGSGPVLGSNATAGGYSSTSGVDSTASGTVADLPTAVPVEAFCLGAAAVGRGHANGCDNTLSATAGDATYTNGNGGFLAGNSVSGQPAGTAELFGSGAAVGGSASGSATESKEVKTGGYNGSQGNDSAGSGNVVQIPVASPAELFGVGGSLIGTGSGAGSETKTVSGGGGGNTQDDNGSISANLVQVPLSTPAQVFGVGGSVLGHGSGSATTDTVSTAGGMGNANGKKGFAAGNIGAVPLSLPVQLHGLGATGLGTAFGHSQGTTDSAAGGPLTATGAGGSLAGNIITGPGASVAQVLGTGAAVGGLSGGDATNGVVSTAGGDTTTNGDGGSIAGNIVGADLMPVAQVFGNAVSVAGVTHGSALSGTRVTSGGDKTTSGVEGSLSGDIFDVPVAGLAQVFGVAGSIGGIAHANALNAVTGTAGGANSAAGPADALSGLTTEAPVGVVAQVFGIPLALFSQVSTVTASITGVTMAEQEPKIDLPVTISELPATGLPSLPNVTAPEQTLPLQPATPRDDVADLPTLPGAGLPAVGLPQLPALPVGPENLIPLVGAPELTGLDAGQLIGPARDVASGQGIRIHG
ncbi:MAG TPA: hypothetical protein VFG87_00715 [Amycolatopsis sp.]|nr:hypothetical protein [Amycolatopsis sp.]